MDPDEAHYAQLTREMRHAGNWMIPLLDGLPYIDKPVLFHWLQGLAIAVLGETETAMRLPSAIAAIALFWLTRWTGVQLFDARLGVRAWLMLATMPMTFLLGSIGVFDMVFTAFLFGAVAFSLVSALNDRPRLQYVSYVLLSLAVMTKGPVALVLAGVFFLVGLACGQASRTALLSLRWITGAVIAVVLSLPWFVWMYYALGWHFVHQYALAGNLYYITQPVSFSNRAVNHTLYVLTFVAGFFPWSIVVLGGAVDTVRRWRARVEIAPQEILLWAWVAVVFLLFSLARFKVDRYVYPAAPACCLLAARAWLTVSIVRPDLAVARDNIFARWSVAVLGVVLVILGTVAGVLGVRPGSGAPTRDSRDTSESRSRRSRSDGDDLLEVGGHTEPVWLSCRHLARDLRVRGSDRSAGTGKHPSHRGSGRSVAAEACRKRARGTVSPREMAVQSPVLPRASR